MKRVIITDRMVLEAKRIEEKRKEKYGKGTVEYAKDRDITGTLAEILFEKFLNDKYITNHCTYGEDTERGDEYDAKIWTLNEEITIDVKGSKHNYIWECRDENDIYIFKHQYFKIERVDFLVFVRVWLKSGVGYILGGVEPKIFKENAELRSDNLYHAKTGILKDIEEIIK